VNAVERCVSWMRFVEISEQIVHKMRQRFRDGHGSYTREALILVVT